MTDTLAAALVAFQKDVPAVEKTARANYGNYATLDHLIAKTRPVLLKHGLAVNQYPEVSELGAPVLRTTVTHTSGEERSSVMPLLLPKQDMQALGAAITYARRYSWAAALGISSEDDDDAQSITTSSGGETTQTSSSARTSAPPETPFRNPGGDEPSDKQLGKIKALCVEIAGLPNATRKAEEIEAGLGPVLTKAKASELIGKLERLRDNHKAAA